MYDNAKLFNLDAIMRVSGNFPETAWRSCTTRQAIQAQMLGSGFRFMNRLAADDESLGDINWNVSLGCFGNFVTYMVLLR